MESSGGNGIWLRPGGVASPGGMSLTADGNVGIGTSSPGYKLDVRGGGAAGNYFTVGSGAAAGDILGMFGIGGTRQYFQIDSQTGGGLPEPLVLNPSGGNVGIGTTSPAYKLDVRGGGAAGNYFTVGSGAAAGDILGMFGIGGTRQYFQIDSQTGGGLAEPLVLNPSGGNIGIGTTTPATRLHVAGDVTVTGSISAKYQDLSEWVPAAQPIAPGTVVILDPDYTNSVMPAFKAYDTRVAGVVSANPGIMLGEAAKGDVKVATTGRVRVRVDATIAPIRTGDLLVTSDREGFAMRSEPIDVAGVQIHRPGTLIGKALESLRQGEGEILVLLSLQ